MEAEYNVQNDNQPVELHCLPAKVADLCNDCQGSHNDDQLKELTNLRVPTHNLTQVEIKSFLNSSSRTGGEVWINAGSSGLVKGWLVDCPALLHRHGKTIRLLQVVPDQPLGA